MVLVLLDFLRFCALNLTDKLLWENLLVENEALVVTVEALYEGDTVGQILSWMRFNTNHPSLPS